MIILPETIKATELFCKQNNKNNNKKPPVFYPLLLFTYSSNFPLSLAQAWNLLPFVAEDVDVQEVDWLPSSDTVSSRT